MEVPRHWRLKQQRYCLVGEICPHCDAKIFPPRDICPRCGGETIKKTHPNKNEKSYIYTINEKIETREKATI